MKSFIALSIIFLTCTLFSVKSIDFGITNFMETTKDVTSNMANDLGNKLPTTKSLLSMSKQLIAGYPFEVASTAINEICSAAVSDSKVNPRYMPDISKMQFQLITACKRYNYPLLNAEDMLKNPEFNPNYKFVLLITGWTTSVDTDVTVESFGKAYSCRGGVNFVALDAGGFIETLYSWSALNTVELGTHVGNVLAKLIPSLRRENMHLIGHSLGAHIAGAAGRAFFEKTGKSIPRITGLDPAKPCFNEGELLSGLMRGDAELIDVIHTNPGVLGIREPIGDRDFYPGGIRPLQPGCVSIICSHDRAWEYYCETIYPGNEKNFMGLRCNSLTNALDGKCKGEEVPMGHAVPANAKGNFFMDVRTNSPYGINGDKERSTSHEKCGVCEQPDTQKE